ncbi:MAG: NifB/NifX family molybdenum-iron cluster-binding protein [Deltaproteobacteria bacterium]|nr:NifB/NifX family molybdenum-iron cluster-binding protein [Deltaproteobacteria bacterium]
MKIAIPIAQGTLSLHFGHCEQFALFSVDPDSGQISEKQMLNPPGHEPGVLPRWLHEQGANIIISGGMGARAQDLFTQNNIQVVLGASAQDPDLVVKAYLDGSLKSGPNACDH